MGAIDQQLLHRIADEVISEGAFPRVAEAEVEAATAFAKSSDWAPEPGHNLPGVDEIMQNPAMWVGYGVLIGLEAARRASCPSRKGTRSGGAFSPESGTTRPAGTTRRWSRRS